MMKQKTPHKYFILLVFLFLSCSFSASKRKIAKAEELVSQKKYQEAILLYEEVAKNHSQTKQAHLAYYRTASIYHWFLHDFEKAVVFYKKYVEVVGNFKKMMTAQKALANLIHYKLGKYDEAIIEYQKILDSNPPYEEGLKFHLEIADCYFSSRAYSQARAEYFKVLGFLKDPVATEKIHYHIATSYYLEGLYGGAVREFNKYTALYPDGTYHQEALINIAKSYESQDDMIKALDAYQRVLKEDPRMNLVQMKVEYLRKRLLAKGLKQ